MNVVSLNKELEMCKSQASRARRSWLQLTTDQDDQAFSCPHPSVNECGREHGLGQGSPLQLIQSLKGLTTEGSLLTPLPAAGAMSPFLMGSLGHPSQSPPYCFEKLSHLLLNQLSVKGLVTFHLQMERCPVVPNDKHPESDKGNRNSRSSEADGATQTGLHRRTTV